VTSTTRTTPFNDSGGTFWRPRSSRSWGGSCGYPATRRWDVSAARLAALRAQLDAELKPVLRAADFERFDLDRAFRTVAGVATALGVG